MLGSGRECTLFSQPVSGVRGWHLHSHNDTIVNALELMAPSFATAYRQLDTDGIVEVDSDQGGDTTQTITVFGIDENGRKAKDDIELNGTTAVDGVVIFSYIENIMVDALSAGIMFIQEDTGPQYIMEIEAGLLNSGIAQHFNGECESYVTYFAAGTYALSEAILNFELRWYPNDLSCRGTSTGYEVLDRVMAGGSSHSTLKSYNQAPAPHAYPMPIGPLPKGGWLCVYVIAPEADNSNAWCTVQGFDVEVPV